MIWYKDIGFRPIEEKDLENIRTLRNDPTTWAYLSDATQINPVKQKAWFDSVSKSSTTAYFSVIKSEKSFPMITEEFIGIIRTDEIDVHNKSVRVGCDIIPSERGKGYGTKALEATLEYWFDNLGMHRVWLCVLENNEIAKKLYENIGFKGEGRYREAIWRDGKYQDYIVMSILVGEYKEPAISLPQPSIDDDKFEFIPRIASQKEYNAYWKSRAKDYDKLDWVNDDGYIKKIIEVGGFDKDDHVLDVGTGTGVVAFAVEPLVSCVEGLDISGDMLPDKPGFGQADIRDFNGKDNYDKITARMVFHHIKDGTQLAMDKCFQALKPGGKFIIAENIPPVGNAGKAVIDEYATIMHLKEDRLVFEMADIIHLMEEAGFVNIEPYHYTIKDFSIKNWLDNNALSDELNNQIRDLHFNASDDFKRASNMRIIGTEAGIQGYVTTIEDILIDSNHTIITGDKPCT